MLLIKEPGQARMVLGKTGLRDSIGIKGFRDNRIFSKIIAATPKL